MKIVRILGKGLAVYSVTSVVAVLGGMGLAKVLPFDWAMLAAVPVGGLFGGIGTAVFLQWVRKPAAPPMADDPYDPMCSDTHGFEEERPQRPHVRGHRPSNPDGWEARIAAMRDDPRFNEAAYRCMGPARYWNAVARQQDREVLRAAETAGGTDE